MKLKGIKTIALLAAAILLVIGSVAGIAAAGAGDSAGDEEFEWNWDACYWWEGLPISPHHQQQSREVGILIYDRYFGIDISGMNWQELDELWDEIGHENQKKAERLFAQYATEKGFEIPGMPAPREEEEEEFIPPPDATYWWEFIYPERREGEIATAKKFIPEVLRQYRELAERRGFEVAPGIPRPEDLDVMRLTPEQYELLLSPPVPPHRLLTIEEKKGEGLLGGFVSVIAVYGKPRLYTAQAEVEEWLDRLREVHGLVSDFRGRLRRAGDWDTFPMTSMGVSPTGYIEVTLRQENEEARAIAAKFYAMIAEKAETLGIQDVPVAFGAGVRAGLDGGRDGGPDAGPTPTSEVVAPQTIVYAGCPYDDSRCPIIGGVRLAKRHPSDPDREWPPVTSGFAVRDPIPWWWDDEDYVTTGHFGPGWETPMNEQIYQPTMGQGNEAGRVADVSDRQNAYADVARVAIADAYVAPYIHRGHGMNSTVAGWRDPVVNEWVVKYGIATGFTAARVFRTGHEVEWPHQGLAFRNQVLAPYRRAPGDSGAPVFMHRNGWDEVDILGIHVGHIWYGGQRQAVFSPVSGVMHELPGWYPYTR